MPKDKKGHKELIPFEDYESDSDEFMPPIKKFVSWGLLIIAIFFSFFAIWSLVSPIEKAAVATGKVTVYGYQKDIQHLEGGIIKAFHIREGSKVKKGELLIQLEDTKAKASLDVLRSQVYALLGNEARLLAEKENAKTIKFPKILLDLQKDNLEISKIITGQKTLFLANIKAMEGQVDILKQSIKQLEKEVESNKNQVTSKATQLKYIMVELKATEYLAKKGLIPKPKLWALKRNEARLVGEREGHLVEIAKIKQKIGEMKLKIHSIRDQHKKDVLEKLHETQTKIADLKNRVLAAKDVLERTRIYAPKAGTVIRLQAHTVGGVIKPGERIMTIVPSKDKVVMDVQVDPLDIDIVRPGLPVKVRLSAYKQRTTPTLKGKVDHVSADSFVDKNTRKTYYLVRVSVPAEELKKLPHVKFYQGMPVSVMIITGRSSPFNYFISPIGESFNKAFKEQ